MVFKFGLLIAMCLSLVTAKRASSECNCLLELNPVCGSDGNTYDNYCELECAKEDDPLLSMVSDGSCNESKDDKSQQDQICDCSLLQPNGDMSQLEQLTCCVTSKVGMP